MDNESIRIKGDERVQELLKPRYKVIAPFPGMVRFFLVKDQIIENITAYEGKNYMGGICLDSFPHLFKPLQWYEEREAREMPKYVREESGKIYLASWRIKEALKMILYESEGELQCAEYYVTQKVMCFFEPSTETDYLTQNKHK